MQQTTTGVALQHRVLQHLFRRIVSLQEYLRTCVCGSAVHMQWLTEKLLRV